MSPQDGKFWTAIQNGDIETVTRLLSFDKALAGKNFKPDSLHTDGFPLYHASRQGNSELVKVLLDSGADPDAKLDTDDPREVGMPLMNALQGGHLDIVRLLLDNNPCLNAHPYCATPFVDCLFNAMWHQPDHANEVAKLFFTSFAQYVGQSSKLPAIKHGGQDGSSSHDQSEYLELLKRVVEMGGQPTLFTVVRHQQHDLIELLLYRCATQPGTAMDWPRGTVFDNICYAASWTGYPETLEVCRTVCPTLYTPDVAKHCIERAIRSHNRDGGIDQYHQLVQSQLEFLRQQQCLTESYSNGEPFLPLHWLAEDFIETANYGFKCQQLSTPDDQIRLAKLLVDSGYSVHCVNGKSHVTVLQVARDQGQREYAEWLLGHGANEISD